MHIELRNLIVWIDKHSNIFFCSLLNCKKKVSLREYEVNDMFLLLSLSQPSWRYHMIGQSEEKHLPSVGYDSKKISPYDHLQNPAHCPAGVYVGMQ